MTDTDLVGGGHGVADDGVQLRGRQHVVVEERLLLPVEEDADAVVALVDAADDSGAEHRRAGDGRARGALPPGQHPVTQPVAQVKLELSVAAVGRLLWL